MEAWKEVRFGPGVRVVDRGRDHLQVGITPGREVVVARDGAAALALETLRRGGRLDAAQVALPVTAALEEAGLLAPDTSTTRSVLVRGDLGDHDTAIRALGAAGLVEHTGPDDPDVPGLLLSAGEPARELLDPWLREGRAHLVVRAVDGVVSLGPFVLPGHTACLRCLDAHRHDADPMHIPVLHRYIHDLRVDGLTDAPPPATGALALAWAARDLLGWLDGVRPATLSSTVELHGQGLRATAWLRHPECACALAPAWADPGADPGADSGHTAPLRRE